MSKGTWPLEGGSVLSPKALQGQVIGGIAQGVGYTLYEEVKMHEGKILNPSFTDYKIPTAHEMNFPIHLHYADTYDPEGPFGSKGAGEPGLVPTAPAIMNAITNACGIRIRTLPITPEQVLAALLARGSWQQGLGIHEGLAIQPRTPAWL